MKYRKKPVVVDAIQWDGTHASTREVLNFIGLEVKQDDMSQRKFDEYVNICVDNGMFIKTLEGTMVASVGDYIVKGVAGEFYPCKPDIFVKTYELAEG